LSSDDFKISEDGYFYTKNNSSWFRIFGTELLTKNVGIGRFRWTLEVENYSERDTSGIAFGVCEETVVND
jgi:hypothetical protein